MSYPKVSPLTLTGITRGPKNKRKEKSVVEEEKKEAIRLEQNTEPIKEANEVLYLTRDIEETCMSSNPIINMPQEEEVILEDENRNEIPSMTLYTSAMEEIPIHQLSSWH